MAFYTITIKKLDTVLDSLRSVATMIATTNGVADQDVTNLRNAADAIQKVRDKYLAKDYDSGRAKP